MRRKWNVELLTKEAIKYWTRKEFQTKDHAAYEACRARGILDAVCGHMLSTSSLLSLPRPNAQQWNETNLTQAVSAFDSRSEFKKKLPGAYKAAKHLGILDKICIHMQILRKKWTDQQLETVASEYSTRQEFRVCSPKAYDLAHRRGILDRICAHMKRSTRVSAMEKELLDLLKVHFPEAKSISDHRVIVDGKPHIKRFEIDIFLRSTMRGIEFDGTYHHSLAGLRRGRKHWPQEDVENYHSIKDQYFKEVRGIDLLHVSEKEWLLNKEKCIQKCIDFLKR